MKKLILKMVKGYLLDLIFSKKFQAELNKRIDIPGMDEAQEAKLIQAIADAIKLVV